ncbi:DEAD/DEAH box helicase [Deinococcus alpinitundrae]|uniref:DEAD/DEAH box helicase n=1 Tax=Deinococcus alpinitundrae TaxID=468913 RepID=UPI001379B80F|nr:DEAD/DEAH box helicase [Deinococcus alpinitundrae]
MLSRSASAQALSPSRLPVSVQGALLPSSLLRWLEQTGQRLNDADNAERQTLVFVLRLHPHRRGRSVLAVQVRRAVREGTDYRLGSVFKLPYALRYDLSGSARDLPIYARRDHAALRLLASSAVSGLIGSEEALFLDDTPLGSVILDTLLASGRLLWEEGLHILTPGPALTDTLGWQFDSEGVQRPVQQLPAGAQVLPLEPPWYRREQQLGRIVTSLPAELESAFLSSPPVAAQEAGALGAAIRERLGNQWPAPRPVEIRPAAQPYRAVLRLGYRPLAAQRKHAYGPMPSKQPQGVAELLHLYGDVPWQVARPRFELREDGSGRLTVSARDLAAERRSALALTRAGLKKLGKLLPPNQKLLFSADAGVLGLASEAEWLGFMREQMPLLEEKGIRVEILPGFPYHLAEIEDWYGETEQDGGWFTLDLGVIVGGERLSLLPILVDLIATRSDLLSSEALSALPDDELLFAALPDGRRLPLPAGRVKAILGVLVELNLRELPPGPLRLPLLDAARLSQLEEALRGRWVGAEQLLALGRRLRDFSGIAPVDAPAGLQAELRPYQLQGLAWLQFLREYDLGGILADDMGLGKTIQTLAHLLTEKAAGRADRPSLVVAPTSVLGNWRSEAARFAPQLRVLTLHGPQRKADFERIPDFDLVLSTYPLLPRDVDALGQHEYHLIILDEAQNIKNARTAATKAAGSLKARHRLCLTGTPLENHLGELWSQFNFLMPGLLYSEKVFGQLYRTPVEKQGDLARRAALAARVRPFLLRREKSEVARELPPKTEIPVRLSLENDQRDLYETVRVTMQEKVREELAARGLSRSTIAVLDALLKLRQAVTDPRLVKLDAAGKVRSNAKLDWLRANLPQMVEEGRRVLIFSAFASLLGLLEDTLTELSIPYAKLTGQTKNRTAQIESFQGGEKAVFLISLKAGGVGLNLTAADTVIHYDPWWNPAAENQATDRAYRIGQDKPVFVYKLIAAGSVEERILEMQSRKAALSQGILGAGLSDAGQLSTRDLDNLFAPLQDADGVEEDSPE